MVRAGTMKPSEACKAAGLKSLAELSRVTGESVQTLNNWHKNKPRLFEILVAGAVLVRDRERELCIVKEKEALMIHHAIAK